MAWNLYLLRKKKIRGLKCFPLRRECLSGTCPFIRELLRIFYRIPCLLLLTFYLYYINAHSHYLNDGGNSRPISMEIRKWLHNNNIIVTESWAKFDVQLPNATNVQKIGCLLWFTLIMNNFWFWMISITKMYVLFQVSWMDYLYELCYQG